MLVRVLCHYHITFVRSDAIFEKKPEAITAELRPCHDTRLPITATNRDVMLTDTPGGQRVVAGKHIAIRRPVPIGQSIGTAEYTVVVFVMQFPALFDLIVVLIALSCVGPDYGAVMDRGPCRLGKLPG
jgi:hypothetical protein